MRRSLCCILVLLLAAPAAATAGNLWLIAVGVSRYNDGRMNLDYADHDANALAAALSSPQLLTYQKVHKTVLTNEQASRDALRTALAEVFEKVAADDVVVISIAGHAVLKEGTYYFLPAGAQRDTPESGGIAVSELERAVRTIGRRTGRVVLFLDTCHAGALEVKTRGTLATSSARPRGASLAPGFSPKDLQAYVLGSSSEREESLEDRAYRLPGENEGHGAFTYALLRGLRGEADTDRNRSITVLELFQYVSQQVPKITGDHQHPRFEAHGADFVLVARGANKPDKAVADQMVATAREHQKRGEIDQAATAIDRAAAADPESEVVQLAREQVAEDVAYRHDATRREKDKSEAKRLVQASKSKAATGQPAAIDSWTPRAMVVTFLGLDTLGTGTERSGLHEVLAQRISQSLQGTKRVRVVDRRLLNNVLDELRLSQSKLADPSTRLNLGRVLAARLIATGDIVFVDASSVTVNLRLVDTETTELVMTVSKTTPDANGVLALADEIASAMVQQIRREYPVRAKVASFSGDDVVINAGSAHGITPGMTVNTVEEQPIKVDGKVVAQRQRPTGRLEILAAEEKVSFARPAEGGKPAKGTKVIER